MKRILSIILMSVLLLGTLTACGRQTDPSSMPYQAGPCRIRHGTIDRYK